MSKEFNEQEVFEDIKGLRSENQRILKIVTELLAIAECTCWRTKCRVCKLQEELYNP